MGKKEIEKALASLKRLGEELIKFAGVIGRLTSELEGLARKAKKESKE